MATHAEFGRRSKDRYGAGNTPFRYPGGKAFLADALEKQIAAHPAIETYAEPFAGGAGAAIELLARSAVDFVDLNDFDRRIYAAWWAILHRTDDFIARIEATTINLETWHTCRNLVETNALDADPFDLGFATYLLNRTNHSGVIVGAGPIGGYKQTGKWLMDVRWYPNTMTKRIRWLGERRDRIRLSNLDGLAFLESYNAKVAEKTFFFIDPPYVQAGAKLYLNAMSDLKHRDLAALLTSVDAPPYWMVTYDDCSLIHTSYQNANINKLEVRYSLHNKRTEHEICVVPT